MATRLSTPRSTSTRPAVPGGLPCGPAPTRAAGVTVEARSPGSDGIVTRVLTDMLPGVTCDPSDDGGEHWDRRVVRPGLPLTRAERELLELVPAALADLRSIEQATTAVSRAQLLEELLVTRLIDRRAPEPGPRTTSTVLAAMRELSTQQEEGRAATSGVVVVADLAAWQRAVALDEALVFEPFAVQLELDRDFFARPAAHHYVDGRNSFYVVGPDLTVPGLVRVVDRWAPDQTDATIGARVDRLVDPGAQGATRAWCATVDHNSTVNVYGGGTLHLRRRSSHWRLLDRGILPGCLREAGMSPADADGLADALTTLSDARTGTLVLVPTGERTPALAGVIDASRCGAALLTHLVGRKVSDLRRNRALLGILSCDGMTMIGPDGELLMTGAIIDLHGADSHCSGGGRTHAGISASGSGVAVMVSADGQITVFADRRVLVHLER